MASRTWAGFSEEELKLLRNDINPAGIASVNSVSCDSSDDRCTAKSIRSLGKNVIGRKKQFGKKNHSLETPISEEESLAPKPGIKPTLERSNSNGSTLIKVDSKSLTYEIMPVENTVNSPVINQYENLPSPNKHNSSHIDKVQEENGLNSSSDKAALPASDLKTFEQRQKRLEAENAKRRELLLKAIDDRKKQTEEEGKKIHKVQVELGKLDSMLSNDVGILRKEIETASLEFYEAQKRYSKAEKEFVESKLLLFQKMERKERLTEHLCTIIEQNEARKARKLGELMHELDLGELYEECKANGMNMVLPQLCALNNITYNSVSNTIKPPHTPSEIISIMPQDKNSESNKKTSQEQLPPPDEV